MAPKGGKRELLEVPTVSPMELRLQQLTQPTTTARPAIGPVQRSSVLDRLKQFMPQMEAANSQLAQNVQPNEPELLDIEHITEEQEEQGQYVEMELACGLFDLQNEAAVKAAERAVEQGGPLVDEDTSSSDDDTDSSSDEDEEEATAGEQATKQAAPASGAAASSHDAEECEMQDADGLAPANRGPKRKARRKANIVMLDS